MSLILDGHKLAWHKDRVDAWLAGERVAPITIDCALTRSCTYNCEFCVAKNTKILMADFTWKEIRDIIKGDMVMGFDENAPGNKKRAQYYPTKVTAVMNRKARLHRLINHDTGDKLFITKEHPVLCRGHRWREPRVFKNADIRFFCSPYKTDFKETYDYKLGYLKGLLEGDGTFGTYPLYGKKNVKLYNKFKLQLEDKEPLDRAYLYIKDLFCIDVFRPNDRLITISKDEEAKHLRNAIQWKINSNFNTLNSALGYCAGIFDSEGSMSGSLRIANIVDRDTVGENIRKSLKKCDFDFIEEKYGVRLIGGFETLFRFFGQTKPAIQRKMSNLYNKRIPTRINVDHDYNGNGDEVYNIETESHTYVANGFCVHNCYATLQDNDAKRITQDVIYRFLDDSAEIGVRGISFVSDGESTCSPHLTNAILRGKSNGIDMALGTNGFLLTEEQLEIIMPHLTYLRFNISAGHLERYCEIHGVGKAEFRRVIANIRSSVALKKKMGLPVTIGLQMVMMPQYGDQVLPLTALGSHLGVDYLVIKHCSDDEDGSLGVDYSKYEALTSTLQAAEGFSTEDYQVSAKWSKIMSEGKRQYSKCYGPPLIAQFSGSGLVAPCGMLFAEKYKKYHIGNIAEQSFKKMWESDRYWEVMDLIASNKFDAKTMCGTLCLQHKCNEYLWDLKHGSIMSEPHRESDIPAHVNFI